MDIWEHPGSDVVQMKEPSHPFLVSESGQKEVFREEQEFNISLQYFQKPTKFADEELSETENVICI